MQKYTLKELADIGAKAACLDTAGAVNLHPKCREAFTKAILDAIGYELPKDEEREAFDVWWKENRIAYCNEEHAFQLWKAGREELRKAINKSSYSMPPSYAGITLLGTKPNEPAWIPWSGGECPLSDKVHRWQYKNRDGFVMDCPGYEPKSYNWKHRGKSDDIIAYRVWE